MANISVEPVPEVRAIRVDGEVDMSTANGLRSSLEEAATAGGPIVIDLRGLGFIDSSGLHALIAAARLIAQKDWCLFIHVPNKLRRIFLVADLDEVPNIHVIYHSSPVPGI